MLPSISGTDIVRNTDTRSRFIAHKVLPSAAGGNGKRIKRGRERLAIVIVPLPLARPHYDRLMSWLYNLPLICQ